MTVQFDRSAVDPITIGDWEEDPLQHPLSRPGALSRRSSILAVIPHFHCERWLGQGLDSLLRQTHPVDGIVVIDDGTGEPPIDVVRDSPQVTLLESAENVGPYRLSQQVIAATGYDAYCFQDADDWSMPTRIEHLLREAERTGAEYLSAQGYRLISSEGEVVPLTYPLDVNAALDLMPTKHAIMHPSSIVTRDLVMRTCGYAMGMRFGGDTEFSHRACHVGRMVNVPTFEYVLRNRPESLTSSEETGLRSAARQAVREIEFARATDNHERVKRGEAPDLSPLRDAEPVAIRHLLGPRLRAASGGVWPN
jgi:glycosyltransferase involved in cell wall biosynthesis